MVGRDIMMSYIVLVGEVLNPSKTIGLHHNHNHKTTLTVTIRKGVQIY